VIGAAARGFIRRRAGNRCEYCLLSEAQSEFAHEIEHIIPKQHGGSEDVENLALACSQCNRFKGPNLTGIDPQSGAIVRLFHPRRDEWREHFLLQDSLIDGLTAVGRTTVVVLRMNDFGRPDLRAELIARGEYQK